MGIKFFSNTHVLTYEELNTTSAPVSQPHDFSDPANQAAAHESAGYHYAGESDLSNDNTIVYHQDDNFYYRSQNGNLWAKDK